MRSSQHWHSADAVRELGLQVGDTIQGRENYGDGYWTEARLTLLWLGSQVAVWQTSYRNCRTPGEWIGDGERANWTLDCRDWEKVVLK